MRSRLPLHCALAATVILAGPGFIGAHAQVSFLENGASRGIRPYSMASGPIGGLAAADFDADGHIDLFVPNGEGVPDQLYRNLGDGTFEEIASEAGLASTENNRAALWFDYDGDGDLDLIVGADCRYEPPILTMHLPTDPCPNPVTHRLYRQNPGGTFEDVTVAAGLDMTWGGNMSQQRSGIIAGDIDNDGWLDLYTCAWQGRAWLLHNNRDGTFSDVTVASGIDPGSYHHMMPIMADMNEDGWTDIYAAVDIFSGNFLWLNQSDGTFVNVAADAGVDDAWTDMGLDLGDYDNDGDLDLYVTNITSFSSQGEYRHNVFYRNDSAGGLLAYAEISQDLGVDDGQWGWGTIFLDADNDTWLDLATTNGRTFRAYATDTSRFWLNTGGPMPGYTDISSESGFDDSFLASGLIAFDFEGDGDLDIAQTTVNGGLRLLENRTATQPGDGRFLVVRPRMKGPNHFGIGAVVRAKAGALNMMRLIKAGVSTLGQEPAEAHFGLGRHVVVDRLTIEWPDGRRTVMAGIPAGGVITVPDDCDRSSFASFSAGTKGRSLLGAGPGRRRRFPLRCESRGMKGPRERPASVFRDGQTSK